jgi:hypothetical protein
MTHRASLSRQGRSYEVHRRELAIGTGKSGVHKESTVGMEEPVESSLKEVSDVYTSKLDRSAMWTAGHGLNRSALGVLLCRAPAGRLASRAAFTCSGVLTSGQESPPFSFARETLRLCRLSSLLFILVL